MKRLTVTKGRQQRFRRGTSYILVSPAGHGTTVRVLDILSLDGNGRRGLLLALDRRGGTR